jgi:hypothetical protein
MTRPESRGRILLAATILTMVAVGLGGCVPPTDEAPASEPVPTTPVERTEELSSRDLALEDLRGCLAVNPVLNVFYLVDNSSSLGKTDPDRLRVPVLAKSLESLASLDAGIEVNWAAGEFSQEFSLLADWSTLRSPSDAQRLSESLPVTLERFTNWQAGVESAQESLAAHNLEVPGCSLLIWFTDGAINLDDDVQATAAAIERLCGRGYPGIVQELRNDQVVIFGVLLNQLADPSASALLESMVEGRPLGNGDPCGEEVAFASHGAVEVVTAADDLARVFEQLPLILAGGRAGEIDPSNGSFLIPAGVSRFVIRHQSMEAPWELQAPNGNVVRADGLDPIPGLTVASTEIEIEITVQSAEYLGEWVLLNRAPSDELFRFSDLGVVVDYVAGGNLAFVSGADARLTGTVIDRDGNPASLGLYDFDLVVEELLEGESQARPLGLAGRDQLRSNSRFAVDLDATSAGPGEQLRLVIGLRNLRTVEGGIPLADPNASLVFTVISADDAPRDLTLEFPEPATYDSDPASGALTGTPAPNGASVSVLVRSDALALVDDRFDRQFAFGAASADCGDGISACGELGPQASSVPVTLGIASGEKAQYSSVTGLVVVEMTVPDPRGGPDATLRLIETVPFSLETERPLNPVLLIATLLVLLAIGLAAPVLLAWALKRALVRIQHGRLLRRAEFPVTVTNGALAFDQATGTSDSEIALAFRNLSPQDTVRSYTDPRLGIFAIHIPWAPLDAPWFGLTPPAATRVISKPSGVAPRTRADQVARGRLVPFNGVLSRTWGLVVADSELRNGTAGQPLRGTLVVLLQPQSAATNHFSALLTDIVATTDWAAAIRSLEASLATALGASPASTSGRDERPPSGIPPRPGSAGSGTPPRGGLDRPASSGPSDPPGRRPPSTPGSAGSPSAPPRPPGR